jgi:hypothetical protein
MKPTNNEGEPSTKTSISFYKSIPTFWSWFVVTAAYIAAIALKAASDGQNKAHKSI